MGLERGFDMRSQEGIDAWMKTYNAELAAGKITPPVMLPGLRRQGREDLASRVHILGAPDDDSRDDSQELASYIPTLRTSGQSFRHSSYNKQKARMAKASRKKNRKRK